MLEYAEQMGFDLKLSIQNLAHSIKKGLFQ
jgi:hypothetical protein